MSNEQIIETPDSVHSPPAIGGSEDHILPVAVFDPDEYREDLKGLELTGAQQDELLQTLWNIMSMMVDIGWGVDTVQLFLPEIFDQVATDFDEDSENLLVSKDANKNDQKGTKHD